MRVLSGMVVLALMYVAFVKYTEYSMEQDLINQYEMVKRNGSAMDACIHAGAVSLSYLSNGDEINYRKWLEIEKRECNR